MKPVVSLSLGLAMLALLRVALGQGAPLSPADEQALVEKAVKGDLGAQKQLAALHDKGYGPGPDQEEAEKWYQMAADQGDMDSQYKVAALYEGSALHWDEPGPLFKKAAEQGHVEAMFHLARLHEKGKGVERSLELAAKWFLKAALRGHVEAAAIIGRRYDQGRGVDRNLTEALAWYTIAALAGNEDAQRWKGEAEERAGQDSALAAQKRALELRQQIQANTGH